MKGMIALRYFIALSLFCCTAAPADTPDAAIEISASLYNPDWERRENASGIRLSGHWMANNNFRLRGTYNSIDTDVVDLPVVRLRGLPFANWRELGAGFLWPVSAKMTAEIEASYQAVDLYNKTESGAALAAGVMYRFNDRFNGAVNLSYFNISSADWRMTWSLYTSLTDRLDLVTRIDDTSEFDFTWYEIGLRIGF